MEAKDHEIPFKKQWRIIETVYLGTFPGYLWPVSVIRFFYWRNECGHSAKNKK